MKHIILTAGLLSLAQIGTSQASTLSLGAVPPSPVFAASGVEYFFDMQIGGGGPLPSGLEANSGLPTIDLTRISNLEAPDAVPFDDTDVTIFGTSPESPTIFFGINSDTRNGGTEGASASYNHNLYQVIEFDNDTNNDVTARGVWGGGGAQISLQTGLYDTSAESGIGNGRVITITNERAIPITFGIEGEMALSMFATADGTGANADATATLDLLFDSGGSPLDIVFAPTSPYSPTEDATAGAFAALMRETDVAGTQQLSLTGSVSALSAGFGATETATLDGSFGYALGLTLQPGQTVLMSHFVNYSTNAAYALPTTVPAVPLPAGLPLMASFLMAFGAFKWRAARKA